MSEVSKPKVKYPLRKKRKEENRQAILDSALQLFAKQGYGSTSLQAVAEQAGLHEQTLFRHFPSKTDLANALGGLALDEFSTFFSDRTTDTLTTWREWITLRAAAHSTHDSRSFFEAVPTIKSTNLTFQFQYERILAAGIAQDLNVDMNKDSTPMLIACMLWGANIHIVHDWVRSGSKQSLVNYATAVVDDISHLFPNLVKGGQ